MKFLSVRDLRSQTAKIWKELPAEKEMVITSNGRPSDHRKQSPFPVQAVPRSQRALARQIFKILRQQT